MTSEQAIALIITALGSGGIVTALSGIINRRKNKAEAFATNISSILDIDARLNERVAKLEERVSKLEAENMKLREENFILKQQNSLIKK